MGFQETFNERVMPGANRAFGITVTLHRGGRVTEPFDALSENKIYQALGNEGFYTAVQGRDWMFPKLSACFGDELFEPRAGDQLVITENGREATYEVLPVGTLPAVEEMDGGYRWRCHTKRVK